jgi:hypothetical protein
VYDIVECSNKIGLVTKRKVKSKEINLFEFLLIKLKNIIMNAKKYKEYVN